MLSSTSYFETWVSVITSHADVRLHEETYSDYISMAKNCNWQELCQTSCVKVERLTSCGDWSEHKSSSGKRWVQFLYNRFTSTYRTPYKRPTDGSCGHVLEAFSHGKTVLRIRSRKDPYNFPGSGSVSYSNIKTKLTGRDILQRIPFVWVLLDLMTRKIK
jgi:hypothetical protein